MSDTTLLALPLLQNQINHRKNIVLRLEGVESAFTYISSSSAVSVDVDMCVCVCVCRGINLVAVGRDQKH